MKNGVILITYPDSLGHNLNDLSEVVSQYFSKAITGIHILPFFPSSGDRGFAPMTYREIDPAFGDWSDMKTLAENYELMYDYMINHISTSSEYFRTLWKKVMNRRTRHCSLTLTSFGKYSHRRSDWQDLQTQANRSNPFD